MKKNNLTVNILLLLGTVLVLFFILELGLRAFLGEWRFLNFSGISMQTDPFFKAAYPGRFDPLLGWIPRPNFTGAENIWKTEVTLLDDGIRSNGQDETSAGPPVILAVGDSYTFGDTVSDNETWPAVLENRLGAGVINGGVFGYGVDQTYLRMKSLYEKYKPEIIIFSFIPDDINRCELAMRGGVLKPYFDNDSNNQLILQNCPLPPPDYDEDRSAESFRRVFGYSFLVHKIMIRAAPFYWYAGGSIFKVHNKGCEVACRIMEQVAEFVEKQDVTVVILIQHRKYPIGKNMKKLELVKACLDKCRSEQFMVLDLQLDLEEVMEQNSAMHDSFYRYKHGGHMTAEGNRFVAGELDNFLRRKNALLFSEHHLFSAGP